VITTVVGALYQLGPMFTQSEPTALDDRLRRVETAGYPAGVALLAGGRLLDSEPLATVGAFFRRRWSRDSWDRATQSRAWLDCRSDTNALAICGRRGRGRRLEPFGGRDVGCRSDWLGSSVRPPRLRDCVTRCVPRLRRDRDPVHVVPFIVWLERYSDRVGLERVPTIDDLYDDRIAAGDFLATAFSVSLLLAAALSTIGSVVLELIAGALLFVGVLLFTGNMALVVWRHGKLSTVRRPPADAEPGATDR